MHDGAPRSGRGKVSVMIFTLNEEVHLPSCLASVAWSDDVIVIDSFSTDRTEAIARQAGARFIQNRFEGFGKARNWAMDNAAPKHEWVLMLDADERVSPGLAEELVDAAASAPPERAAYRLNRHFHMWGRWLRHSSLYPTWVVRFVRVGRVRYVNRGHAETQEVDGAVGEFASGLIDENLKGIDAWYARQNRYSSQDAEFELAQEEASFRIGDLFGGDPLARRAALKRIGSRLPGRPILYFVYSYFWRRGFMDGRDGLTFCMMKSTYQAMVVAKKYDLRRARQPKRADGA